MSMEKVKTNSHYFGYSISINYLVIKIACHFEYEKTNMIQSYIILHISYKKNVLFLKDIFFYSINL